MTTSTIAAIRSNCEELLKGTAAVLDGCERRIAIQTQRIWEAGLGDTPEKNLGSIKILMENNWPVGTDFGLFIVHHKFDENSDKLGIKEGSAFFTFREEGDAFILSQKEKLKGSPDVIRVLTFGYDRGPILEKEERF